jgi:hypothetical protein
VEEQRRSRGSNVTIRGGPFVVAIDQLVGDDILVAAQVHSNGNLMVSSENLGLLRRFIHDS